MIIDDCKIMQDVGLWIINSSWPQAQTIELLCKSQSNAIAPVANTNQVQIMRQGHIVAPPAQPRSECKTNLTMDYIISKKLEQETSKIKQDPCTP